ncbi:hypothetical protein OAB57_01990, partial [Bacteriovoracaceae bacterium]|nr:hypothetical protein [Bacteriovoracaceae bacterium]
NLHPNLGDTVIKKRQHDRYQINSTYYPTSKNAKEEKGLQFESFIEIPKNTKDQESNETIVKIETLYPEAVDFSNLNETHFESILDKWQAEKDER